MTDQPKTNPDGWNPSHGYATQYAVEGLKALVLANGGAVVAILTFCGNTKSDRFDFALITTALPVFACALFATLLAMTSAYYAQANFTQSSSREDEHDRRGDFFERLGGVFVLIALCLFVAGTVVAARGFRPVPVPIVAVGQAGMSCAAAVEFIRAQADATKGAEARNPETGSRAVLIRGAWVILPNCARP